MIKNFLSKLLLSLSAKQRKSILLITDLFLILISKEIAFWMSSNPKINFYEFLIQSIILILTGFIFFTFTGQYQNLSRYIGSKNIYQIILRNLALVTVFTFLNKIIFNFQISAKISFQIWIISTMLIGFVKLIFRDILVSISISNTKKIKHIAIYGAGKLGAQLASLLKLDGNYTLKVFFDDKQELWNRYLFGVRIIPIKFLEKYEIDQIYIAISDLSKSKKRVVYNESLKKNIRIMDINPLESLTKEKLNIDAFKPIEIEKILGRDTVKPFPEFLGPGIKNKVICITGAGGSIGSELCRQCFDKKPKKLILIDNSEPNLYHIHEELVDIKNLSNTETTIIPFLVNAVDHVLLERIFIEHNVQIVLHAAAYKHVPLVEMNPVEGIKNNVLSVRAVCRASIKAKLQQALFISSDKAVRPTNVMGATKRVSEIIVKSYAKDFLNKKHNTVFSSVRFGNVIGSSGSVIPKFNKQILEGGPITITHKDIVRYFMTIEEAAQLVLQAAFLAKGGETFLLDMGEPVKIFDLAKQMLNLNGYTVKDDENINGDIEIVKIGLRPGEKLYEELLISGKSLPTKHPLIYIDEDQSYSYNNDLLRDKLSLFESSMNNCLDTKNTLKILAELVPEWHKPDY